MGAEPDYFLGNIYFFEVIDQLLLEAVVVKRNFLQPLRKIPLDFPQHFLSSSRLFQLDLRKALFQHFNVLLKTMIEGIPLILSKLIAVIHGFQKNSLDG